MRLSAPDNTSLIEERTGLTPSDIASFCQHWQIAQMAVFGSVLRNDFNPDSDIDILIRFSPGARQGLLTLAQMKYQLEDRTGRVVDLVSFPSVEQSENPIRRDEILSTARIIYEQR